MLKLRSSIVARMASQKREVDIFTIMKECENGGQLPRRRGACKVAAAYVQQRATEKLVKHGDKKFWAKNTALAASLYAKECVAFGNTHPDGCYEAALLLLAGQALPRDVPTGLQFMDVCCGDRRSAEGNGECCRIADLIRAKRGDITLVDLQPAGYLQERQRRQQQQQQQGGK
jgi:hypothetical protein